MTRAQTQAIRAHLESGKSITPITPIDALALYGCFRLAARINDLRNDGLEIETTIEQQGDKRYARYSLAKREVA